MIDIIIGIVEFNTLLSLFFTISYWYIFGVIVNTHWNVLLFSVVAVTVAVPGFLNQNDNSFAYLSFIGTIFSSVEVQVILVLYKFSIFNNTIPISAGIVISVALI